MTPFHEYTEYTFFYNGPFCQWVGRPMIVDGIVYDQPEQYMMAQKARLFGDNDALRKIMLARSPGEQKALGRKVRGFDVRVWETVARDVVMRGSLAKFTQDEEYEEALMRTEGTLLVEASPTDVVWGIGLSESDPARLDPDLWRGKNWLGEVLTELRENLRLMY